jgi:hypothetical protein
MIARRSFIRLGIGLICAPAIVRASSLMPVRNYDTVAFDMIPSSMSAMCQDVLDFSTENLRYRGTERLDRAVAESLRQMQWGAAL